MLPGGGVRFLAVLLASALVGAGGCAGRGQGEVAVQEGAGRRALASEAIAAQSVAAVAEVRTDVGVGLAFVVDPRGYLLTNRHVVEDSDYIEEVVFPALRPPRRFGSVRIVYIDPARDLALLKVEAEAPLPALALATDGVGPVDGYLKIDDRVLLLARGDDAEASFVAHSGRVNDLEVLNPSVGSGAFVGLTNDVRRGQSGGPVLDRYGRAAGVVTWTWRHKVGGFAIPIAEAMRMLRDRPRMETRAEQGARAEARVAAFVAALNEKDLDGARRMLAPSYARDLRRQTVDAVADLVAGDGREAAQRFFAALEELADDSGGGPEGLRSRDFTELVLRTGSKEFMRSLGADDEVAKDQVVSFFFEFGQAYLSARYYGHEAPGAAMDFALDRLRTLDAARTFAFAELSQRMGDGPAVIEKVEVIPGVYAPQAVAVVRAAGGPRLALQMKVEWGDWYVAQVQALGEG